MQHILEDKINLATLYELALSIGHSNNTSADCEVFLNKLISLFGFSLTALWQNEGTGFEVLNSYGTEETLDPIMDFFYKKIKAPSPSPILVLSSGTSKPNLPTGLHILFQLEHSKVLYFFYKNYSGSVDPEKWKQLEPVLNKFVLSLNYPRKLKKPLLPEFFFPLIQELDFDGIVLFDEKSYRPLTCNPKVLEYLGTDYDSFLKTNPLDWFPTLQSASGKTSSIQLDSLFKQLPDKRLFRFEWTIKNSDGSIYETEVATFKISFLEDNLRFFVFRNITEKKKAIHDLKISTAHLRQAQKMAKMGTFEYDFLKDRAILSNSFYELLGFNKPTKPFNLESFANTFINPEVREMFHERISNSKISGKGFEIHRPHLRKDGSVFFAKIIAKPKIENGQTVALIGSIQDITDQYKANKALKINQKMLEESQTLAKIGSSDFDPSSSKLIWSKQTFHIFGIDPQKGEPSIEEYHNQFIDQEGSILLEEKMKLAIAQGIPFEIEIKQKRLTGETIYTICTGKALQKNGETYKVVGTIQDITERKLAEQKIHTSNQKYNQLFDNMYDAIVVTDTEGRIIDANKSAQKMLGYNLKELNNFLIPDLVHPDDMEKSKFYLDKLKSDGFYSDYQGRVFRKDGQVVYIQVNSNAIYEDGVFAGSRDIVRDITDLKKAEEKREQLLTELEMVNQELSDFAYVVSHDLKAPLRAISSLSHWLHEDYKNQLDQEGVKQLELLVSRSSRMHNFIEGILEYSRIGRLKGEKEWIDLQQLLMEVIDAIEVPAHFKIIIPEPLPSFYGEKVRLHQIFQNLIFNAISYNDKEKGEINLSWKDQDTHIAFAIKDNGPGIPKQYHDKIFKIFQTLQSRDQIESTGIGLTIVKRIIQQYEGQIWVNSIPKQSTTFEFTLKKSNLESN